MTVRKDHLVMCGCGLILENPQPPKYDKYYCFGCMKWLAIEYVLHMLNQAKKYRYHFYPGDFAPGGKHHFIEGDKPPAY